MGSGFKSRGAHENPVSSHESWVFFNIGSINLEFQSSISITTDAGPVTLGAESTGQFLQKIVVFGEKAPAVLYLITVTPTSFLVKETEY